MLVVEQWPQAFEYFATYKKNMYAPNDKRNIQRARSNINDN